MFNFNFNFNFGKEATTIVHTPAELKKIVKNICSFKKNEIENINWALFGSYLLQQGYKTFLNVVFNLIENRPLETHKIQKQLELTFDAIEKQKIKRLVLNMPPRAGKSNNARYFCLYTMLKYSGVNYIYTSYNAELLVEFAGEMRKILDNPLIIEMFGLNKADSKLENYEYSFYDSYFKIQMEAVAKSTNKKIKIRNNNLYLMCVGTTTGLGCFDYNTLVNTNQGFLKIGDIVENKKKVKVLSYNFKTKRKEFKIINDYIKNEKQAFLKLVLSNGEEIEATPDHKFYLNSGEEIEAINLKTGLKLFSNSFYLGNTNIKLFRYIKTWIIFIKNICKYFWSIVFSFLINTSVFISLITKPLRNIFPSKTSFYITNITDSKFIISCYFLIWSSIFCYLYCLFFGNLAISSVMPSISYTILLIIGLCSVCKIIKIIVQWIIIKMANNKSPARLSYKSKSNESMNKKSFTAKFIYKIYIQIAFMIYSRFNKFIFKCGKNISIFINKILGKFRYLKVVDIINSNHKKSYCLSIRDNNNFFISKSQVLIHNCGVENKDEFCGGLICDDLDKITNVYIDGKDNEKTKQWFSAVLLSRLQGSAFLLEIQQRLSKKDISGYILENYSNFEHIALPLVAEDGSCNIPYYKEERIKELQLDNEVWQAQYQQQPINDLGVMPFADCPVVDYRNQRGDWVAWFDPAGSGKDYSALALIRRHGVMLEVLGWQWRKDWRFVVSDLLKIDELVDIRRLIVEINFTGDIIIQNLLELGIQCHGHRTTKNKIKKILAMQIYAQNINLVEFKEFESKANKDFINNVLDWSKGAKHDDGADALSSYLDYSGLINS